MLYPLTKIWHPENYQDGRKALGYFEGWYFRAIDAECRAPLSIIPGVAIERTGRRYAFVQVIRGTGETMWFEYPFEDFAFSRERFDIRIGPSRFAEREVHVELAGATGSLSGSLSLGEPSRWPVRPLSPGIMGPFRFVPFMECYHGIVSMDHTVDGTLLVNGEQTRFDGGRGYTEKDWGRSFPKAWLWAQCNRFSHQGMGLTLSIARIPWVGSTFVGSIAGLLHRDVLYRFTTYTGARVVSIAQRLDGADVVLEDTRHRLEVSLSGAVPGALRSPVLGAMEGTVRESLHGTARVRLSEIGGRRVIVEDSGTCAGIELMDPTGDLLER